MPIWLRRFTFNKIKEYNENQSAQAKGKGNTTNDINQAKEILQKAKVNDPRNASAAQRSTSQIKVPDFVTSRTKASKK
jgi:hypothetical protein